MKNNLLVDSVDFESEVKGITSSISFFIGRSDTCHVVLDDPQVSREHAELTFNNGLWTLKKLAELSVILINGNPITEMNIQSGDIISISNYSITVFIPPTLSAPILESEPLTVTVGVTETLPESEILDEEAPTQMMDMESLDNSSESLDELSSDDSLLDESELSDDINIEDDNSDDDFVPSDDDKDEELFDDDFASDEEGDNYDGGYGVDGFDDDAGEKTVVFTGFSKFELEIFGEFAPFDKYNIENGDLLIGRDEKCNIILNDPEVSTIHASIKKNNVLCILEDKNSANGTLLNGARISSNELVNGDEFIIGSTTFTVKVQSDLIEQEKDRLMPVQENQEIEVEEIEEVETDFNDEAFELGEEEVAPKSLVGKFVKAWKDPDKRKKIIIGLVLVVGAWVMFGDEFDSTTPAKKGVKQGKAAKKTTKASAGKVNLTPEQLEFVSSRYELSKEFVDVGKYSEAIIELDAIMSLAPNFKNSRQLYDIAKQGRSKLETLEQKKQAELAKKERERKIKILLEKATDAVEKHQGDLARELFSQVMQQDPENYDIPQLKNQLEAWEKEQERIKVEKAEKERERKFRVSKLAPGKNLYLKKQWFRAIGELEIFLRIKEMDEDLTKEGADMLKESRSNLSFKTGPLLGKARSLREGQDLKGAYENYKIVLEYDPVNLEAIKEMGAIRETLENRARKIYREAIIDESLSLFDEAKHKFQEVQQVAPTDSGYYDKATNKLKEYME